MKIKQLEPLFVDIETMLFDVSTFRLGKQFLSHGQMLKSQPTDIICITYCFDKGPGKCIMYDPKKDKDTSRVIKQFDDIVRSGNYYIVGQNSDSFDIKHINTLRMIHGLDPFPEWADLTEDTLKQVKKHFKFPSNRLDFADKLLGNTGKLKMEFEDWVFIKEYIACVKIEKIAGKAAAKAHCEVMYDHTYTQIMREGPKRMKQMGKYGTKDVVDTRSYFKRIEPYIKPKVNRSQHPSGLSCIRCDGVNIKKNGPRKLGTTWYQQFQCNDCGKYAGRASMNINTGQITGKMRG